MFHTFLQLNKDKTEVVVFAAKERLKISDQDTSGHHKVLLSVRRVRTKHG